MQTIDAIQGDALTYLVHTFGRGFDGEDRFVVERFWALADGGIRSIQPVATESGNRRRKARVVVSREAVEAMRPGRTEIIVCTGLRTRGARTADPISASALAPFWRSPAWRSGSGRWRST